VAFLLAGISLLAAFVLGSLASPLSQRGPFVVTSVLVFLMLAYLVYWQWLERRPMLGALVRAMQEREPQAPSDDG
jgi:hypothetical protein